MSPEVRASLRSGPARAFLTVGQAAGIPATPVSGPSVAGLHVGPYRETKLAVLTAATGGVTLVRDYDQLPIVLVSIANISALELLSADPAVRSVTPEGSNQAN